VSRFTNRTEDVAVEALGFILARSAAARNALRDILETGDRNIGELTRAKTQVSGEDGARPDLVLMGADGAERVLVEAKFWASLTSNQPDAYIARLPHDENTSVLLFIAPEARLESLWTELSRVKQLDARAERVQRNDFTKSIPLEGGRRYLQITSWRMLLDRMASYCTASGDSIESDIRQLTALCERQDQEAFLPIDPGEFAPQLPRRVLQLNQLVDDAVGRGRKQGFIDTKGLIATSKPHGYGRYLYLGSKNAEQWAAAWFGVNCTLWARFQDTPLWLTFDSWEGVVPISALREKLGTEVWANTDDSVPVPLPTAVEYEKVLAKVVEFLCELGHRISEERPRS